MSAENHGRPPPPAPSAALRELRLRLDGIDEELVRLIASRMETVGLIIAEKQGRATGIKDPKREHEILTRVETLARAAGVSVPLARKIFSEIISHSVSRQASILTGLGPEVGLLRVAYVGTPFTFNHLAAQKFTSELDEPAEFLGQPSVKEALGALEAEVVDLAFLNIESTAAGSINQVYDVLREKDLHIVGEETIKVDLCLCGLADVPLPAVQRVLSHPLALEQCSVFLEALPNVRTVAVADTAEAMRLVAEAKDPTQVAVGSPEAAETHGLLVLRRGIGNHEEILHRYVALARAPVQFDARIPCKTSLILSTRHEHGALLRCIETLGNHGLSLTKLESRPHPDRPWEYMFFTDFEGNIADPRVAAALDELRARALFLKVLGCYPAKATPVEAHLPGIKASTLATPAALDARPAPPPAPPPATVSRAGPHRLVGRGSRSQDTLVRVGNLLIGGQGFVMMAGPAAVESEEQIQKTARFARDHGAHVLRGGVFRSRSSPDGFPGLGLPGLDLLAAAGRAVGMPVMTEVMSPQEVRPVSERSDLLQVGAQNMQNFPLLREVAKVNRPVLLERGLSATIDEWLAAAEYVLAQGNGQVILCERGIRTFESATPSTLDLSAVVVLRERTHLPVLVDPSHATGRRAYVPGMAWAARACGAHGLLVELHPEPEQALADAEQSLSFPEFAGLMEGLARWRA
jgi:chorismate mutase / prephenate dehydratase